MKVDGLVRERHFGRNEHTSRSVASVTWAVVDSDDGVIDGADSDDELVLVDGSIVVGRELMA